MCQRRFASRTRRESRSATLRLRSLVEDSQDGVRQIPVELTGRIERRLLAGNKLLRGLQLLELGLTLERLRASSTRMLRIAQAHA